MFIHFVTLEFHIKISFVGFPVTSCVYLESTYVKAVRGGE